jgi:hypothetical protein
MKNIAPGERYTEWVSGVNQRGEPFIQLAQIRDGKRILLGQMTPNEARSLAMQGIEAAEAAETDAYMWKFFKTRMELQDAQVAAFIADFRDFRAQFGTSEPTSPEHWNAVMDEIARARTGKSFDPTKKQ